MNFRYKHGDRPLAGYTIKRGVGHGGFGEVYYAVSDGGREVALKSIIRNQEIELRGIRHCINLKSPHLVSIFDVRTGEDGSPFVVMEYVAGPSLRDLLHENPAGLGEQKAGYLVREIARGLSFLHDRGIVHRDLKPENIFFEDGYVKIGDYGLSKYMSASRQSGQTISVGTVHYMAPEIGSGTYDRGIDIYALGIMLFELLSGDVPFTGNSFGEILMKHLTMEPDLSGISETFRPVIAKALAKKPEDRYPNMDAFLAALFQNDALNRSVSTFNPASLSTAARQVPVQEGPASPKPPPLPKFPQAAGTSPIPAGGLPSDSLPFPGAPPRRQEATTLPIRLLTAFGIGLGTIFLLVMSGAALHSWKWPIFSVFLGTGTAAIFMVEKFLSPQLARIHPFKRRLLAGFLAVSPGVLILPFDHWFGFLDLPPFFLGFILIDWQKRLSPQRSRPIAWEQALSAAFIGFFAGVWFANFLLVPICMAGISLMVNCFAGYARKAKAKVEPEPEPAGKPDNIWIGIGQAAESAVQAISKGLNQAAALAGMMAPETDSPKPGDVPDAMATDNMPPAIPDQSPQGVLPHPTARFAWMFMAAALFAGGLSCFAVLLFQSMSGEEMAICLTFGLSCFGYLFFALYRGLWARHPHPWQRTIKPFLLTTLANTALVSLAFIIFNDALNFMRGDEEYLFAAIVMVSAIVLLGFIMNVEGVLKQRSHPALRFLMFLLTTIGGITTISLAYPAFFMNSFYPDQVPLLCCSIGIGALTLFLLYLTLKKHWKSPWQTVFRPLLGLSAMATGGICLTLLLGGELRYDEEKAIAMVVMIFSVVFGLFAMFMKRQPSDPGQPVQTAQPDSPSQPRQQAAGRLVNPIWLGIGILFWFFAAVSALGYGIMQTSAFAIITGGPFIDPDLSSIVRTACFMTWIAFTLLGSIAIVLSRRKSGALHFCRGMAGQFLWWIAMSCYYHTMSFLHISGSAPYLQLHGSEEDFFACLTAGLVMLVLGIVLLALPCHRKKPQENQTVIYEQ